MTCEARFWRGTGVPWLRSKRCRSLPRFPAMDVLAVVESERRPGGPVAGSGWLFLAWFLLPLGRNAFLDLADGR